MTGHQPEDDSRRIPSDHEICFSVADDIVSEKFAKAFRIKQQEPDGPHYKALLAFLNAYVATSHERAVWNGYFDFSRPKEYEVPRIEAQAKSEGLTYQEYVSRETLRKLKHFLAAKGIPRPEELAGSTQPASVSCNSSVGPSVDEHENKQKELSPRFEQAYRSFCLAETKLEREVTAPEAYEWLKENGPDDYPLPDFGTWSRYVREGRAWHDNRKNSPRGGRTGRSIVRTDGTMTTV